MTIFTVHLPRAVQEPAQVAETLRVVPELVSLGAFFYGPLWLARHRAWLALAGWVVAVLALASAVRFLGLPGDGAGLILLLIQLFLAVEGYQIVRTAQSCGRYRMVDVIAASSPEEAEEAFLRRWTSEIPVPPPVPPLAGPVGLPSLGLFADSGRPT